MCDATRFDDGDLSSVTVVDGDPLFTRKSLVTRIFVVSRRLRSISRITTTNQEVAGSSPAGPANDFNHLATDDWRDPSVL